MLWRYVDFTKAHRAAKARIFLPVSPQKIRSATLQIKIFLITLSPQKKFIKKYFFVRSDLDFFLQIASFRKETSMTGKLRSLLDASMIWRTNTWSCLGRNVPLTPIERSSFRHVEKKIRKNSTSCSTRKNSLSERRDSSVLYWSLWIVSVRRGCHAENKSTPWR